MKILIFGNPLFNQDALPPKLLPTLQQKFPNYTFQHLDPTEDLTNHLDKNKNITIIDTAKNLSQIKTLTLETPQDFEKLILPKSLTMHDFDLAYNLRLLKKINLINQAKIICIPTSISKQKAIQKLTKILTNNPNR